MEETEHDRAMKAGLAGLRECLDWYAAAFRDGRDRTNEAQKLAASFANMQRVDMCLQNAGRHGTKSTATAEPMRRKRGERSGAPWQAT